VRCVHTLGEASFAQMGRGYPQGYVDIDLTYWKDLTGEDD